MRDIKVDPNNPKKNIIIEASRAVEAGKVIAFPTDTIYGLGADVNNNYALDKIYRIKKRSRSKPLIIFIADVSQLKSIVSITSKAAEQLAKVFWPGALTLILPARENLPVAVTKSGTVGVRLPDCPLLREIIRQTGTPLATTSANLAGLPNSITAVQVRQILGDNIDMLLDGGAVGGDTESTIIDATRESIKTIRSGAITMRRINKALEKS